MRRGYFQGENEKEQDHTMCQESSMTRISDHRSEFVIDDKGVTSHHKISQALIYGGVSCIDRDLPLDCTCHS
jgi:hypothetical protein